MFVPKRWGAPYVLRTGRGMALPDFLTPPPPPPVQVLGWWPSRAVSFLENHDTGSSQNHWPFPAQHLQQGYVYLLTHPGTPCIFYDHLWTDGLGHTSVWRTLKRALLAGRWVML